MVYLFEQVCAEITSLTNAIVMEPLQLSVADTLLISGLGRFEGQSTFRAPLQFIIGGVASLTVMVKEQDAVFPFASDATKVLVVVPTGKKSPCFNPAV